MVETKQHRLKRQRRAKQKAKENREHRNALNKEGM